MRDICSRIVAALSDWWGYLGWVFFLGLFFMPFVVDSSGLILAVMILTIAWWIIDVVDQATPIWMIFVGLVMLGIGIFAGAGILVIACWVIYWTRVRE